MPDFDADKLNGEEFEASVRHVARQLYRHASLTGSIKFDGQERDEIIDTGTELIVIEATTSRKLEKTKYDFEKSAALVRDLKKDNRFSEYNFRIMLVTAEDPTADQNNYISSMRVGCPKEIISFNTLFSRLFNARHYIRIRGDYSFGSVRDPANESDYKVPQSDYVPIALSETSTGASIKAADLASTILNGGRFVVYGDYGSGKSMTLRDVYFRMRDRFVSRSSACCPVYLNLREHIAQTQPDEALYRHAEKIGFPEPHSLIAAWRAGFVAVFLDGFDELTPPQFASSVSNLRQARRFAVEIVKRFIEQTPKTAPVIIAGRESYFDGREEAQLALGYGNFARVFDLAGFTDSDIKQFLKDKRTQIPAWLPTRPLLLGYLANAGLLKGKDQLLGLAPARGWDQILQRVCEREVSQVWGVGFEASDLRLFIEGLATYARKASDGKGLEDSTLRRVFRTVFGRDADEPASLLTGRLPGLGSIPGRPGAREFIDIDFSEAAASGDLSRYIESPFIVNRTLESVAIPLGSLGREMAVGRLADANVKTCVALRQSAQNVMLATTSGDLLAILGDQEFNYDGIPVSIRDAHLGTIIIDPKIKQAGIILTSCLIENVEIDRSTADLTNQNLIQFHDCIIGRLDGAASQVDVPIGMLTGSTTVERYAAFNATNEAVMNSRLPDQVKVLLTILRKLFMQRGTGRQHSALKRGMPPKLTKYVDPIISLIKAAHFASDVVLDRRAILIPNRALSSEIFAIVNGPNTSNHPIIARVKSI
jgi:hypothetical protein